MLSPVCDNYRLILGIIAVFGEIIFAGMTGIMREDIVNLYRRLSHKSKFTRSSGSSSFEAGFLSFCKWFLLIASFYGYDSDGAIRRCGPFKDLRET